VLNSSADIGLASTETSLPSGANSKPKSALSEIRSGGHKAIVLLTHGRRAGLSLMNAPSFLKPSGTPVLQVSGAEDEWLHERARRNTRATVVACVGRTDTQAFNVTANVGGQNPDLRPIVISTPRSGWWQCASERGSGIACWLEAMRTISKGNPSRDCSFVAFTGHELGFLGIKNYIQRRPDILRSANLWIHFGANLGAARQTIRIQAADDSLAQLASVMLRNEGIVVDSPGRFEGVARGEASVLQKSGVRYLAPIFSSDAFHHASDRWPEAVDLAVLARCSQAFSNLVLECASHND